MKASQRLYRTADGTIVAEGDPRAAFLVAVEGGDVDDEYAKAVKAFESGDESESDDDDDSKAVDTPANKAVKKAANK